MASLKRLNVLIKSIRLNLIVRIKLWKSLIEIVTVEILVYALAVKLLSITVQCALLLLLYTCTMYIILLRINERCIFLICKRYTVTSTLIDEYIYINQFQHRATSTVHCVQGLSVELIFVHE